TTLLSEIHSSEPDAQLAARLQIATDSRLTVLTDDYSVLPWQFPQAVAATGSLINRSFMDAAVKWIASQPDDEARTECLAYWAQEVSRRKAAD
ncbi:hypothetical protein NL529_27930, partial [Klebsiella pneumoniae]|nr:hypothetical protein [Klebsiella pneumoniae]